MQKNAPACAAHIAADRPSATAPGACMRIITSAPQMSLTPAPVCMCTHCCACLPICSCCLLPLPKHADQQIAIFPATKRWLLCSGKNPPNCPAQPGYWSFGFNCVFNKFTFWYPGVGGPWDMIPVGPVQNNWFTLKLTWRADTNAYVRADLYRGRGSGANGIDSKQVCVCVA
jgi:hypothetical protein